MYASIAYHLISFELWLLYEVSSGAEFYNTVSAELCCMFLKMRLNKNMLIVINTSYSCFVEKHLHAFEQNLEIWQRGHSSVSGCLLLFLWKNTWMWPSYRPLRRLGLHITYGHIRLQQTNSSEGVVCIEHVPVQEQCWTFCSFRYQVSFQLRRRMHSLFSVLLQIDKREGKLLDFNIVGTTGHFRGEEEWQ